MVRKYKESQYQPGQSNQPTKTQRVVVKKRNFLWATRTQILFWYALIFSLIFVTFVPTFRHIFNTRVNYRVNREISDKMNVFNHLLNDGYKSDDSVDRTLEHEVANSLRIVDKRLINPPKNREELKEFFDAFLGNQLPEDDTFLIAFLDGKFYKSSPRARPKELKIKSRLIQEWGQLTEAKRGEEITPNSESESIIYLIQPVKIQGKVMGVFAIAHSTSGERGEILEAVNVIIRVGSGVLIIALIAVWLASGQILKPLKYLTQTAQKISESDLNERIVIKGKIKGSNELAELAKTFNEMMDRLEDAFVSQRNFINDAGHELRTPITIIRGHLELMDNENPQEVTDTISLIDDELERMNRFVQDLILLAKAEQPDFLQLETVDIKIFSEEIFSKVTALAERNWQLEKVGKGKIIADRQRLTQTVMNLVQNATQHTTNTDTIALGSEIYAGQFRFWVRDTGEGIAPQDQKRIFERFSRSANSRRRSEGAGLGLAIVRAIVEAHGGDINLVSDRGVGSTFTIILPLEIS